MNFLMGEDGLYAIFSWNSTAFLIKN